MRDIERAWYGPRRGLMFAGACAAAIILAAIAASYAETGAAITGRPARVQAGAHAW